MGIVLGAYLLELFDALFDPGVDATPKQLWLSYIDL